MLTFRVNGIESGMDEYWLPMFILIGQIYLIRIVSELFQNQYNMEIILMKLSSYNGNGLLKMHEHVTSGTPKLCQELFWRNVSIDILPPPLAG